MARIAFAWELGANYGHLSRTLPVAEALRARGHRVVFVTPDANIARSLLKPKGFGYVCAPPLPRTSPAFAGCANYGQILADAGYLDRRVLLARLNAWLALWRSLDIEAIVIDHAPTALLAARLLSTPVIALGTGFTVPPDVEPMPSLRSWEPQSVETLRRSDAAVIEVINGVLLDLDATPLRRLADLFVDVPALLTTFAELDHYGHRPAMTYIGPTQSRDEGEVAHWQDADRAHVFAYLRTGMPHFEAVLAALGELSAEIVCVIPDATASLMHRLRDRPMRIFSKSLELEGLLCDADAVISYGGAGLVAQSLLAGAPMLILPAVVEQYVNAQRVVALNAGIVVTALDSVAQLVAHLQTLLSDARYRQAAQRFAQQYSSYDPARASELAADTIARLSRREVRRSPRDRRRVLYAWELGSNAGHLERGLAVAEALRARGVETIFAVRQFDLAQQLLNPRGFECISCPNPVTHRPRRLPVNFSDLLLDCGFDDPLAVSARAHAWAELYRCLEPEAVIVDYAPTAQLAAYACDLSSVQVGSGFAIPPAADPLPSLQHNKRVSPSQLRTADRRLLDHLNQALSDFKTSPLRHVSDLFTRSPRFITTFAELDPYPSRDTGEYVGPIERVTLHQQAQWRTAGSVRVFAYLRPLVRDLEGLLRALHASDMEVICAIPGVPAAIVKKYQGPRMRIFDALVEAPPLLTEADLVVSYGSAGLIAQSLLAGVPLLLTCDVSEQIANSRRVVELGAGIALLEDRSAPVVTIALHSLANEPRYRLAARRFAEKYRTGRPDAIEVIVGAVMRGTIGGP